MRRFHTAGGYLRSFFAADEEFELVRNSSDGRKWFAFSGWLILGAYGTMCVLIVAIIVLNPFGNFPITRFSQVFADNNQRYSYPSIVRSGEHQSAIFGTSTSRLLKPSDLGREFEGKFANLSMDAATAWEQTQLTRLFLRHVERPQTIILSLDKMIWCNQAADLHRVTFRLFPQSFYDENPINDFSDVINLELWDAIRKSVKMATGSRNPYQDKDGFGDFTPGEENYDPVRAHAHIHNEPVPRPDATLASSEDVSLLKFPALDWLSETLDLIPTGTNTLIVHMPVNVTAQSAPGTRAEQAEKECVRRIQEIATSHSVPVFDMAFASPFTTNDLNYWDRMHYRVPLGEQVVKAIGQAYRDRKSTEILQVITSQN